MNTVNNINTSIDRKKQNQNLKKVASVALAGALALSGTACKDKIEPIPAKLDHETKYTVPENKPEGFVIDPWGKKITVPENISDEEIKRFFEKGAVKDQDGWAALVEVVVNQNSVKIIYKGVNGKTGESEQKTENREIIRTETVANFPNSLPWVSFDGVEAGDVNFFQNLAIQEIELSDNTKIKIDKILVNGVVVDKDHIINKPGTYTVTVVVKINGKEQSKEYTLTVKTKEVKENDVSNLEEVDQHSDVIATGVYKLDEELARYSFGNTIQFLKSGIIKPNTDPNAKVTMLENNEGGNHATFIPEFLDVLKDIPNLKTKVFLDNISFEEFKNIVNEAVKNSWMIFYEINAWPQATPGWMEWREWLISHPKVFVVSTKSDFGHGNRMDEIIAKNKLWVLSIPSLWHRDYSKFVSNPAGDYRYSSTDKEENCRLKPQIVGALPALSYSWMDPSQWSWTLECYLTMLALNENNLGNTFKDRKEFIQFLQDEIVDKVTEPVYFRSIERVGEDGRLGNPIDHFDIELAKTINGYKYIKNRDFARNSELQNAASKNKKIPVFKYSDLIQNTEEKGVIFTKEIWLSKKDGVWYFDPNLAIQQGYDPKDIAKNPDKYWHFIVKDGDTCLFDFNADANE